MSKANVTLAEAMAILFHNRPVPPVRPASKEGWRRLRHQLRPELAEDPGWAKALINEIDHGYQLRPELTEDAGAKVGLVWRIGRFAAPIKQRIEDVGQAIVEMIRRRDVEAWGRYFDCDKDTGASAMVPVIDGGFLAEPLFVDPCEDTIRTEIDRNDRQFNPVNRGYHDVVLNRAQLLAAIGVQRDVARSQAEAPAPPEPARRGRRPKYDWEAFHCEITRIANTPDGLPEIQADLERMMAKWCQEKWGQVPSESMIREHLSKVYEACRGGINR